MRHRLFLFLQYLNKIVNLLNEQGVQFASFDILQDEAVRQGIERERELTERLETMKEDMRREKKEANGRFSRAIQLLHMLQKDGMSVEPEGADGGGFDDDDEQDERQKKRARVDEAEYSI